MVQVVAGTCIAAAAPDAEIVATAAGRRIARDAPRLTHAPAAGPDPYPSRDVRTARSIPESPRCIAAMA